MAHVLKDLDTTNVLVNQDTRGRTVKQISWSALQIYVEMEHVLMESTIILVTVQQDSLAGS